MKKNGIKNFIFSFFMSLLAVVVVNKAVFDAPKNIKTSKKSTSDLKSISLFSKTQDDILSEKTNEVQFNDIESLVSAQNDIDVSDLPAIDIKTAQVEPVVVYNPELNNNEISSNNIVEHDTHIDIATASQIILDKSATPNNTVSKPVADVVYSDISDTFEVQNNENKILLAHNDVTIEEENLIPITEDNTILHNQIDILTSSEGTQIAMLEPTALVNSIESFDKPEEEHIADINLKESVISAEKQNQVTDNNDSPWVVAQGNRFAKNKIAQINVLEETDTQNEPKTETNENIITVHKEENVEKHENTESVIDNDTKVVSEISATESIEDSESEAEAEIKTNNQSSLLGPKPLLIPTDEQGTKLAYKMIQNLIIPLPDDIATDADIVPQLSSEPNKKDDKTKSKSDESRNSKELKEKDKESSLFKSISSWFSRDKKDEDTDKKDNPNLAEEKKTTKKRHNKHKNSISLFEVENGYSESDDLQSDAPEIMPAELKLSFQPNRAEISGYTLRWIHAFADNARDNADIYIEIRIDGTNSFALQQKRLNLLSSIFANRGVDFRKVNVIFTSREPNSFIIRNLKFSNSEELNNQLNDSQYYQHW